MYYRIYLKHNGRFQAITGDGGITNRLIYASMFTKEQGPKVIKRLREKNPNLQFDLRKI